MVKEEDDNNVGLYEEMKETGDKMGRLVSDETRRDGGLRKCGDGG